MGKYVNPNVTDLSLTDIKTNGNKLIICSTQPTDYTSANSTYALGSTALAAADYTLANGDVSGRKLTVAAKPGVPVATSGTGTHIAIVDTVNQVLKFVTTCPSMAVAAQGTADVGSFKLEVQAPS